MDAASGEIPEDEPHFDPEGDYFAKQQADEQEKLENRKIANSLGLLRPSYPKVQALSAASRAKQQGYLEELGNFQDGQIAKSGTYCPKYLRYKIKFPPFFVGIKSRRDLSKYLTPSLRKVKSAYLLPAKETNYLFF